MNNTKSFATRPENLFLLLGALFGIIFLFVTPPWNVPDEEKHFFRAYQVSEFQFIEENPAPQKVGGYLPRSLETLIWERALVAVSENTDTKMDRAGFRALFTQPLSPRDREFLVYPNPAMYSPIAYIPPAIGILAARLFEPPPILLVYAGRLTALIIYLFVVFLAIRITPIAKWVFFLLALMPLTLFQAVSLSADSFTIAAAFLMTAVILDLAYGGTAPITSFQLFRLFVVAALLALSKQAYALIALAYLIIPISRIGTRRKYWGIFLSLSFLIFALIAVWCYLIRNLYVIPTPSTSVEGQFHFIITHPLQYLMVLARTTKHIELMTGFLGNLGWRPLQLPEMLVWPNIIIILLALQKGPYPEMAIKFRQRLIAASIVLSTILIICTIAYIDWTPVGHPIIRSLQGRYFLPLFPFASFIFYRPYPPLSPTPTKIEPIFPLAAAIFLLWSIFLLLKRFWI